MHRLITVQGIKQALINSGDFIQIMFQHGVLIMDVHRAVHAAILTQSGLREGSEIHFFLALRQLSGNA